MSKTSILIAEDHALVREGLRALLELSGGFTVVGEAATGGEAVELAARLQPDVIVMDVAMPVLNGFQAARQIRAARPAARVLALSAHADEEYVERMVAVGAAGYVLKQDPGAVFVQAVREIAAGGSFFSRSLQARRLVASRLLAAQTSAPSGRRGLTAREAEVLQQVAEGAANKQIALALGISIKTVEKHRQRLMEKLGIHETAGLTRHAIATGVIESSIQRTTR